MPWLDRKCFLWYNILNIVVAEDIRMIEYSLINWLDGYKGLDKDLTITHEFFLHNKKTTDMLLEYAFRYYDLLGLPSNKENFEEVLDINRIFRNNNINSAVICYDDNEIEDIFGYPVEFLGVDMVLDRFESWLDFDTDTIEIKGLNENGLFPDLESALSAKIPHESWVDLSPIYTYLVRGTNQ